MQQIILCMSSQQLNRISQTQEQTKSDKIKIIRIQQLIKHINCFFVKYNGKKILEEPQKTVYTLTMLGKNSRTQLIHMQVKEKANQSLTITFQLSLKSLYNEIKGIGLDVVKKRIQDMNINVNQIFIYEFMEKGANLVLNARTQIKNTDVLLQLGKFLDLEITFLNTLTQSIFKDYEDFKKLSNTSSISSDLNSILSSTKVGSSQLQNLNDLQKLSQYQRIKRDSCSQIALCDSIENLQQKKQPLYKKLNIIEQQLKQKFSHSNNILRCIKVKGEEITNDRINNGVYGIVQKYKVQYLIDQAGSINIGTNKFLKQQTEKIKEIQKKKQIKSTDKDSVNQQQKYISHYLVKKIPKNQSDSDVQSCFVKQLMLLATLRDLKCASINSFYYQQTDKKFTENNHIYSDFQPSTTQILRYGDFNMTVMDKLILSLIQGLYFLKKNGISHRDLKPDNILLSSHYLSKIIDFGSGCHTKFFVTSGSNNQKQNINRKLFVRSLGKVFSNAVYYQSYESLSHQVKQKITACNSYYSHPLLDIRALGMLIELFKCNQKNRQSLGQNKWKAYINLCQCCKRQNPQDRPEPIMVYLQYLELVNYQKQTKIRQPPYSSIQLIK